MVKELMMMIRMVMGKMMIRMVKVVMMMGKMILTSSLGSPGRLYGMRRSTERMRGRNLVKCILHFHMIYISRLICVNTFNTI